MSYAPLKPDPGPSPKLDAPTIKTNFAQFGAIFSKLVAGVLYNHTPFNSVNQGNHESVIFEKQTLDPGVTQDLDVIYAKDALSAASTEPQLFFQIPQFLPNEIPNSPMQLTYNKVNTVGPQYQSFIPGGSNGVFTVYIGSTNVSPTTVTLVPAPRRILSVIGTCNTVSAGGVPFDVSVDILNASQFTINSPVTGIFLLRYIAIARA